MSPTPCGVIAPVVMLRLCAAVSGIPVDYLPVDRRTAGTTFLLQHQGCLWAHLIHGRIATGNVVLRDPVDLGHPAEVVAHKILGLQRKHILKVHQSLHSTQQALPLLR